MRIKGKVYLKVCLQGASTLYGQPEVMTKSKKCGTARAIVLEAVTKQEKQGLAFLVTHVMCLLKICKSNVNLGMILLGVGAPLR